MKFRLPVFLLSFLLLLSGCTIAPKPIVTKAPSFSEGVQDSGIKGFDSTGLFVNQAWIDELDKMRAAYGRKMPASEQRPPGDRAGVRASGFDRYHVEFQVNDEFADLKYFERNSTP